jgi:predicted transcriptional regulator
MSRTKSLSDLQMAIMRVLWQQGETTVAQVHEALHGERGLAMTTIATILSRLEKQGMVAHSASGRQYVYRPLVFEAEVRRSMVADLIDRLFQGSSTALVSHLLQEAEIGPDDLARVRALLAAHERPKEQDDAD